MNIQDIKSKLIHNYPTIEPIYNKNSNTLKLENIETSVRFGMGYRWNLILYFEKLHLIKKEFECCTFDNSSTHFCKILEPTAKVQKKSQEVLECIGLI